MSLRSGIIEAILGEAMEEMAIGEAADAGYDTAIDMCGNEGQVSIIDMTGYGAFEGAAETMAADGLTVGEPEGLEMLISSCPYPEAVGAILEEANGVMAEIIREARGEALEALAEEQEEEDEDNEDFWD